MEMETENNYDPMDNIHCVYFVLFNKSKNFAEFSEEMRSAFDVS